MRIAVVHEWFVSNAGSEKVVYEILKLYPNADVFTIIDFLPEESRSALAGRKVTTSFIQHLPFSKTKYRHYLPLMPLAIEQLDVSSYDLIISSSHAVAKGILTGPDQLHICYCHTPMRYAWDLQHQYLQEAGLISGFKSWLARWLLHRLRLWDARTSNGVDYFLANSDFIRRRIRKIYRRNSTILHPPVDLDRFPVRTDKEDFYLTASRLVPYKKISMIVEAFSRMPERKLVVIGDGPELSKCKALAGSNVEILGFQPDAVLRDYMQRAKCFVFAAEEDFGIIPIEAQACGTPVIAYGKGGVLETLRGQDSDSPTAVFFNEQTVEGLMAGVDQFEAEVANRITSQSCRDNAERFNIERFRREFSEFVDDRLMRFRSRNNLASNC